MIDRRAVIENGQVVDYEPIAVWVQGPGPMDIEVYYTCRASSSGTRTGSGSSTSLWSGASRRYGQISLSTTETRSPPAMAAGDR